MWRASDISRFPMYDGVGTARGLVDNSGAVTGRVTLGAFGHQFGPWTGTTNPYRYGGAWGYMTDPSGLLQSLGPGRAGMAARRA